MVLGQLVELHQHRIGRAMDIDRIGLEAHFGAVGRQRLDFVQQHNGWADGGCFGDGLCEQIGHRALCFAHGGTRQCMRLDLQQTEVPVRERLGCAMREAACERGLASSGRTDEQDRAVQGKDGAIDLGTQGEVQNRLREKLLLQGRIENDRIPQGAQCRVGQQQVDPTV